MPLHIVYVNNYVNSSQKTIAMDDPMLYTTISLCPCPLSENPLFDPIAHIIHTHAVLHIDINWGA